METISITQLEPITEPCSILVNVYGALDLNKIEESVLVFMAVKTFGHYINTSEWLYRDKKERELKRLSLKMEMIMRNMILNDEHAMKLNEHQLLGYLMAKAYLLTGHYPSTDFIRSAVKLYYPMREIFEYDK